MNLQCGESIHGDPHHPPHAGRACGAARRRLRHHGRSRARHHPRRPGTASGRNRSRRRGAARTGGPKRGTAYGDSVVEFAGRPRDAHPQRAARHRSGAHQHRGTCHRSEEHTSELQSHRDLHSFPTRRSSDLEHDIILDALALHLDEIEAGAEALPEPAARNGGLHMGTQLSNLLEGLATRIRNEQRAIEAALTSIAAHVIDRKSTRLNSSHTEIYTLSLHDALPISSTTSSSTPWHCIWTKSKPAPRRCPNRRPETGDCIWGLSCRICWKASRRASATSSAPSKRRSPASRHMS